MRWANPERVAAAVREYAQALRRRDPAVSRVLWYGSWVAGVPTPSSDMDLCVVLDSDGRRPRDRLPDYLPDRFPVGIDLIVLTEEELEKLTERSPAWHRAIVSGKAL